MQNVKAVFDAAIKVVLQPPKQKKKKKKKSQKSCSILWSIHPSIHLRRDIVAAHWSKEKQILPVIIADLLVYI